MKNESYVLNLLKDKSRFVGIYTNQNLPRYFMIYEKSCGAVIYYETNGTRVYLVEKMLKGHKSLCKGHVEENTEKWIIDGNYNRTIEVRLAQCDTVFLFDLPVEVCLQGAVERIGKARDDLPWLETELDPEFEDFIKNFHESSLPRIYELTEKHKKDKQIIVFKSREEADEFLLKQMNHSEAK